MKSTVVSFICFVLFCFMTSCKDEQMEKDNQRLVADNNRMTKAIAFQKSRFDSLQSLYDGLKQHLDDVNKAKDTLQQKISKQAQLELLRKKAESMPFELKSVSLQNHAIDNKVLKASSPFKKSEVRFLTFKGMGINNAAKVGRTLKGKMYGIFKKGSMIQQMAASGTFKSNKGINQIYTNAWEIVSKDESFVINKGIGDKSRGILATGQWTLELWFQPNGATEAYKLTETKFEIN